MRHVSILRQFRLRLTDALGLKTVPPSDDRQKADGSGQRLMSKIIGPFHRSIHIRFQYAFGLAVLGLVLMAVITIVSGRTILNTYELSVNETRHEMMPIHNIQVALREVDHLAYRYAVEGDQSAQFEFQELADTVDTQFHQLSSVALSFASVEHAHSSINLPDAIRAWREVKADIYKLFQYRSGTTQAIEALKRAHMTIDPVYDVVSEFHHLSMRDLQIRLASAQSAGKSAFTLMFGAIVVGMVLLIAVGRMVGRSVLQPIGELLVAAHKLGEKDFSHRIGLRNNSDELGQLGTALNLASATLQKLYLELERRSTHDGLTSVLNRAAFDERLQAEFKSIDRHKRPLSLLMVDIDFFKRINDTYGHQAGDRVLQSVAKLLEETTRPGDVVTRYGGEEFAIILPETDAHSAMAMAERLRAAIEEARIEFDVCGAVSLTVSVGCATRMPLGAKGENLVKAADSALYDAKNAGRNRVSAAKAPSSATSQAA